MDIPLIICKSLARRKLSFMGWTVRIFHRPNVWMVNMILQDFNTLNVKM